MRERVGTFIFAAAVLLPATGAWTQCVAPEFQSLQPEDGAAFDSFGTSVSMSQGVAVIGAPEDDDNGDGSGSAYVFRFGGEGWVADGKLTAFDGGPTDKFGSTVATDGTIIAIGAPQDDSGGINAGAVYVYRDVDGIWTFEAKLLPFDTDVLDGFGSSVAVTENTIVAGAPFDDESGLNAGAAYVFEFNGATWAQEPKLTPPTAAAGDRFGHSVSVRGNRLIVGAPGDGVYGEGSGSAHVFQTNGLAWSHILLLAPIATDADDEFGTAVAIFDDYLVVGAPRADVALADTGAAFVYERMGAFWILSQTLVPESVSRTDRFGDSVAIGADFLGVGAPLSDAARANSGYGFVFQLIEDQWVEQLNLAPESVAVNDEFGRSVTIDGEIGLLGSWRSDINGFNSGSAYLFGAFGDCDDDGVPDACQVGVGGLNDCNDNGIPDECDIEDGTSEDVNCNGFPDECDVPGDLTGDGILDGLDLFMLLTNWGDCVKNCCPADLNGDGVVNGDDLGLLLSYWQSLGDEPIDMNIEDLRGRLPG